MTEFLLWFDCETTGLDPDELTVLEVAWTVTNADLVQLTPLRQRYTRLGPGRGSRAGTFSPFDNTWEGGHFMSDVVADMHKNSGLRDQWRAACKRNPRSILTSGRALETLILEDVDAVAAADDRVVLAGAGVSHFDNHVLAKHCPGLQGSLPVQPTDPRPMAYYTIDSSVAWRALGKPDTSEVRGWRDDPFRTRHAEVGVDQRGDATGRLIRSGCDCRDDCCDVVFDLDAVIEHRAADDVVKALVDLRRLRALYHSGL